MCRDTSKSSSSFLAAPGRRSSSFSTTQGANIVIRRYDPSSDYDQVRAVFSKGMASNFSAAYASLLRSPFILGSLVIWTLGVLGISFWFSSISNTTAVSSSVIVCTTTVAALTPLIFLVHTVRKGFGGYIQKSLADDLSNIENVYGGKGCFLIAQDESTGKIVGIVGGQDREEEKGRGVYELRRMSVDGSLRRSGVGKRLIQALEKELEKPSRLYLTCSNIQYAAHGLYQRVGFVLKEKFEPTTAPFWFRSAFVIYRYEKEYKSTKRE